MKKKVGPGGLNGRVIRPHNRATLLRLLQRYGPTSRTWLGELSGLTPTTITNVVAELIQDGLVAEQTRPTALRPAGRIGRPTLDVDLVAESHVVLGVQIGVGRIGLAVCDLRARVVARERLSFDPTDEPTAILDRIGRASRRLLRRAAPPAARVLGVGAGVPGPVDAARRVNRVAINLAWRDVAVADRLEAALELPVVVDHNVRAMALAAAHYGLGQDADNLAFVNLEAGIGAGLILNRMPYGSGRFGHLQVDLAGLPCRCGSHGCLETVVSERVLIARAEAAAAREPDGRLAAELRQRESAPDALFAAARAGDPAALAIVEQLAEHVGTALASLVNLLSPELIVLGGLFVQAGDLLLEPIRRTLRARAFPLLGEEERVELSIFGADAGVVGAAAVALEVFFYARGGAPERAPRADDGPWTMDGEGVRATRVGHGR